ncbi:MAG: gluconeogenesis factor YvcK family protein [Solirubrobacteraceae bacterium]
MHGPIDTEHRRDVRRGAIAHCRRAMRVVAFGGGTGLPVALRGLRETGVDQITAVVTVADDGGSSGRLRQELGVPAPGDLRRCLVALAGRQPLAEVFEYRFESGAELRDHSVGNILIAALFDMLGGSCEGVEQAGRFLQITGRVLPAATGNATLVMQHTDGSITHGESAVHDLRQAVRRVSIEPASARAPDAVIEAIDGADLVLLSPGSLFTSTIPALLGAGVPEALARFGGPVIYAANVMTQPGETVGFTLSDHLRAIIEHIGPVITDVLVDDSETPAALLDRYRAEGAERVVIDRERVERLGVEVHALRLLASLVNAQIRHDPVCLAEAVYQVAARSVAHLVSPRQGRQPVPPRTPGVSTLNVVRSLEVQYSEGISPGNRSR